MSPDEARAAYDALQDSIVRTKGEIAKGVPGMQYVLDALQGEQDQLASLIAEPGAPVVKSAPESGGTPTGGTAANKPVINSVTVSGSYRVQQ